jgi:hypothetical protein
VFFYVIEGFVEDPLFSSRRMRLVGRVLHYVLGVLTLGLPWWLPVFVRKARPLPLDEPEAIGTDLGNGHAKPGRHEGIVPIDLAAGAGLASPTIRGHRPMPDGHSNGLNHEKDVDSKDVRK